MTIFPSGVSAHSDSARGRVRLAAFVLLLLAARVEALTYVVTKTADTADGTCNADCSLREAIAAAEANAGADTVTFGVDGTFSISSTLPTITGSLTINGNGAASDTIDGGSAVRLLHVSGGTVAISGLRLAHGLALGTAGADAAGNLGGGGGGGGAYGGALFIEGAATAVTLQNVTLDSNVAQGGTGGDGGGAGPPYGGSGGAGGASTYGAPGGAAGGNGGGNGGGGGGAGGGFVAGGAGGDGNAGGGAGQGGSRGDLDPGPGFVPDVGGGGGGSGDGCGGGSPGFGSAGGDFAGDGGFGFGNCTGGGGGGGGGAGLGGAIYVRAGSLTLNGISFVANAAIGGPGGASGIPAGNAGAPGLGKGGAFFVDSAATVSATNVTFNSNVASDDLASCTDNDNFFNRGVFPQDPPTDLALAPATVAENQPVNTVVGGFTTTDLTPGDSFTYTLVAGAGSTNNAQFNVSGGQLRTSVGLDYEAGSTRSVRVRTTDQCGQPFEKAFTLTVANVNENPTALAPAAASVAENQPAGTAVATLSTSDPDVGDSFAYTLVGGPGATDNALFQIAGNQLTTAAPLDFEAGASRSVRVRSTDAGGLFVEQTIAITVANANESPTALAPAVASVAENQPAGTAVATLSTSDPDVGDSFVYTLVGGPGATDNALFQIAGNQLTTAAPLDFEAGASRSVRVRSTDAGGLFVEQTIAITVVDVDEPPTALDDDLGAISEDAAGTFPAPGVLANDDDPESAALTVTAFQATSAQGATVTVAADGAVTYDPRSAGALQALTAGQQAVDEFSYTIEDPAGHAATATARITVDGSDAGLSLTKTLEPAGTVRVDDTVTWHLTVANGGPGTATDVVVTDTLPAAGVTFLSSTCGTPVAGVLTWTVGTLAASTSSECLVVERVTSTGVVANRAEVTAADTPQAIVASAGFDAQPRSVTEVPALGGLGETVLATGLATLAWRRLRRRRR